MGESAGCGQVRFVLQVLCGVQSQCTMLLRRFELDADSTPGKMVFKRLIQWLGLKAIHHHQQIKPCTQVGIEKHIGRVARHSGPGQRDAGDSQFQGQRLRLHPHTQRHSLVCTPHQAARRRLGCS